MTLETKLIRAVRAALTVPLTPAPARSGAPSAVYRCHPGRSDGSLATADITVRVFHHSPEEALRELSRLRKTLLTDGDSGVVGKGADTLILCETDNGGLSGAVSGTGLYVVQAGFTAQGRV